MIQLPPVNSTNTSLKDALNKLSRESFKLTNVGGKEGVVYMDTTPTTDDLDEGAAVLYYDGINYRIYVRLNNVIKYMSLT